MFSFKPKEEQVCNSAIYYIEEAIQYIESNIYDTLTVNSISGHVYISSSYLQKTFKTITNISIMDYVRSRKLSSCLFELRDSDQSIVSIAEKYGYQYTQSFSRAFKSHFGISPHHYRLNPIDLKTTPKMDLSDFIVHEDSGTIEPLYQIYQNFDFMMLSIN